MIGARQQKVVIERVMKMVIVDRLVDPRAMEFTMRQDQLRLNYDRSFTKKAPFDVSLHNHAINQLCAVAEVPKLYVNRLLSGCVGMDHQVRYSLLRTILNTHFRKGMYFDRRGNSAQFLHRIVQKGDRFDDDRLCGFLSRSFNHRIQTAPLMKAFVEQSAQFQAGPVEAFASDTRLVLKSVLPHVFEPVPGEYVGLGATFANSDFGAGKLKVAHFVMRVSSGTTSVLDESLSRVHLGSIIQDSDIDLSDATSKDEMKAMEGAVRDAVNGMFEFKAIERALKAIEYAHQKEIPWHKLKGMLSKVLRKDEIGTVEQLLKGGISDVVDLPNPAQDPDNNPVATGWWASNLVGWMAVKEKDPDRKSDLQELGGELLAG